MSYLGPVTIEKSSAGKFDPNVHTPHAIRLAEILGWDHIPVSTDEERREFYQRMGLQRPDTGISEVFTPEAAVARLAEEMGWDHIPVMTEDEEREADRRLAEALEDARKFYGQPGRSA
jgi:uncharacterized protein YciW